MRIVVRVFIANFVYRLFWFLIFRSNPKPVDIVQNINIHERPTADCWHSAIKARGMKTAKKGT